MVAPVTPAFVRSAADVYGRPAMIFFAVAGPTPGSASRSFSDAVFKSTGPEAVAGAGAGFAAAAVGRAGAAAGAALADGRADAAAPTVTSGVSFSMVAFGTPAFARSAVEAYGRPAMIFFAVAAPTPGS